MSFMFKPYPFTDPVAVNHIQLPSELRQSPVSGNAAVAAKLLSHEPRVGGGILHPRFDPAEFHRRTGRQVAGHGVEYASSRPGYRAAAGLAGVSG